MSELLVPAQISNVTTVDPGEVRIVELSLPSQWKIENVWYPVLDTMRPGTAFLAKPWGARTEKWRRRMYTRSNMIIESAHVLETIINNTHTDKSDTSVWWQSDDVLAWLKTGHPIDIRVQWNDSHSALQIYENCRQCQHNNLRLEPDGEWGQMRVVALALSTGITPFLACLRYMKHLKFGRTSVNPGACVTLIVSVQHEQQLMAHEELLAMQCEFPENFYYHPVLTKSWPKDWDFTTGRIIRTQSTSEGHEVIDVRPLLSVCPDIHQRHVRFCGNTTARNQLQKGLQQEGINPLSFRGEVW